MKKRIFLPLATLLVLLLMTATALAADTFKFDAREVDVFEGESVQLTLVREGACAGEGTLTFTSSREKLAEVDGDGLVLGLQKGTATVTAKLQGASRSWKASITVNVLRRVTAVALKTSQMTVYWGTDPAVSPYLEAETDGRVIVLQAGKTAALKADCQPSDASNRKVTFTSTDDAVMKVTGTTMKAVAGGECQLIVASEQNPEVAEVWHVLVIQPVKKITVLADTMTVNVGEMLQMTAACEPADATMQSVTWTSRSPQIAAVDENGLVTALKKGRAEIVAKAVDGSGKSGSLTVQVAQPPTDITMQTPAVNLIAGERGQLKVQVLPSDANDKTVSWYSTDSTVATVDQSGRVTGVGRGECQIIAVCKANASLSAEATVNVIQRVTSVAFLESNLSVSVGDSYQLSWMVQPSDASIPDVSFSSSAPNKVTVDADGVIRGVAQGSATITATAVDGSREKAQLKVRVTQPVEGVSIQYQVYHIQLEGALNIKALLQPSNADNTACDWRLGDPSIATLRSSGKNVASVTGVHRGTTSITARTQDGGYEASAEIRVGDFNRAVVVDDVYLDASDKIRLVFRNRSDFDIQRVTFYAECYTATGQAVICNVDGLSNHFTGSYNHLIEADGFTEHYQFTFDDYVEPVDPIAGMNVYITSWTDTTGYTRNIPQEQWPMRGYYRYLWLDNTPVDEMEPTGETGTESELQLLEPMDDDL